MIGRIMIGTTEAGQEITRRAVPMEFSHQEQARRDHYEAEMARAELGTALHRVEFTFNGMRRVVLRFDFDNTSIFRLEDQRNAR